MIRHLVDPHQTNLNVLTYASVPFLSEVPSQLIHVVKLVFPNPKPVLAPPKIFERLTHRIHAIPHSWEFNKRTLLSPFLGVTPRT